VAEISWTPDRPRLRISTTRAGVPSRQPVLMLHGLWHASWAWESWAARLAQHGHDCHAVDLRGHGASEGDVHTARLRDFIEDAHRAVAALPAPPILIGHSLGGSLVEHLLATNTYPGAVLVAGVPGRYPLSAVLRTMMAQPGQALHSMLCRDLRHLVGTDARARRFLFGPTTADETVRHTRARLTSAAPHVIRDLLLAPSPRPRSSTPILVLAGTRDAAFSPRAQLRHATAVNADYREIVGSGHDVPLDHGWKHAVDLTAQWLAALQPT